MLTEPKILVDAEYAHVFSSSSFTSHASCDAGTESVFGTASARWSAALGKFGFEMGENIEARSDFSDENTSYLKHRFDLHMSQKFNSSRLGARLWVEGKNFANDGNYNYDYNLLKSQLAYSFDLANMDWTAAWVYAMRAVPDSADANYDERTVTLSTAKLWNDGHFADFSASWQSRHFPSEDERGSFAQLSATANGSLVFARYFLEPSVEFERRNFLTQDELYFSHTFASMSLVLQREFGEWKTGIGPKYELQTVDTVYEGERWWELGANLSADFLRFERVYVFADVTVGKRFYENLPDSATFSSYSFVDFSATAAFWVSKRLRLDASAFLTPEWHTHQDDDRSTSYFYVTAKYGVFLPSATH